MAVEDSDLFKLKSVIILAAADWLGSLISNHCMVMDINRTGAKGTSYSSMNRCLSVASHASAVTAGQFKSYLQLYV